MPPEIWEHSYFADCQFLWLKEDADAVAPVRNQRASCCTYQVVVDTVSAMLYLRNDKQLRSSNPLTRLSVQELIDCLYEKYPRLTEAENKRDEWGVTGATFSKAYKYVEEFGLYKESDYEYEGVKGTCRQYQDKLKVDIDEAYVFEANGGPINEEDINEYLKEHPLAANLWVYPSFDAYTDRDGVYMGPEKEEVEGGKLLGGHAVLLVGYGMRADGVKFFVIKNSAGEDWGYKGFGKVSRDVFLTIAFPVKHED